MVRSRIPETVGVIAGIAVLAFFTLLWVDALFRVWGAETLFSLFDLG